MEDPQRISLPEAFNRERDVYNLFAAFKDIPQVDSLGPSPDTHAIPSSYTPKPASDASLAAFCQLAALRLNSARSLISLIDDKNQYILAEATPRTSLKFDSPLNRTIDLGFGNVCLPRKWGICEQVLDPLVLAEGRDGIVIINDLTQSKEHSARSYVKDGPLRFYAGVPLISTTGSIVGAICILDDKVRDGLPEDDIMYLMDLASTVMDYLDTYAIKDRYRRGAEGLHGLMSFAEGTSKIKPFNEFYKLSTTPEDSQPSMADELEVQYSNGDGVNTAQEPCTNGFKDAESSPPKTPVRRDSISDLQESLLPATTKQLFARAADIMRRCNEMDGVMFMDASIAATGFHGAQIFSDEKRCQILGFSTVTGSSLKGHFLPFEMTPLETNFEWVLEHYPNGYSLNCEEALENSEVVSPSASANGGAESQRPGLEKVQKGRRTHVERLQALIPGIKSALFLPLWDFERSRWFAGCFCWSTRVERILDGQLDLPFLKAFGHSIMQEVARLDALTTDRAKTTFLSSLSHELRTPLHGILGSSHLLRNTEIDSFQSSMINSITVCGRTLLETVEHLLDHAERREPSRNYSSKTVIGENCICIASERLALTTPQEKANDTSRCNLGFVTEEMVETMMIGQSPFDLANTSEEPSVDQECHRPTTRRRSRFLILDIEDSENLGMYLSTSSYGRLVMNLFGNALKFTESGYIQVSLRCEHIYGPKATVVLNISDSGIGMSQAFLKNSAFEPFRKQNQHTSGIGVGLSVVKRILEDIGGQIMVQSDPSRGTNITLKLPLERITEQEASDPKINPLPAAMTGLKDRKVCVYIGTTETNAAPEQSEQRRMMARYVEVLCSTLSRILKSDVKQLSTWDGHDDTEVMICPEVSFESLHAIRSSAANAKRKCPATIFVAMDVLEAETLRSDARVTSKESIVETMTQPAGPYKLAILLQQCLQQYDAAPDFQASTEATPASTSVSNEHKTGSLNGLEERVSLYPPPPLVIRTKADPAPVTEAIPTVTSHTTSDPPSTVIKDAVTPATKQALIVDDNAINRRLLSAWMKRRHLPYSESHDGLHALNTYKSAPRKPDIILMDISMPVMDGMTSTRLIREYEKANNLSPTHIIALTGLTSASAKLEAWTSGVDDFLTKPVDFKRLEGLMEQGRGEGGEGFGKDCGG
ncbi:hypothetical protein FB567DRAFT_129453 [Paraphoma chrysanthemicola]|uniref:histidine kinase n=1 Tax=Paraphoma chrysanthemicola TaxID=798071 RepID=A0A8K0QYD6_9PLEO|nr:hypothetical protein FB567DRAFT_129453 [Paraphoma chrysanthemicola]